MILVTMLIILTATLVIVIIGFVMDRMAITKLKSGMRTLNKRIKRLERGTMFATGLTTEPTWVTEKAIADEPCIFRRNDDEMDSDTDSETQEADGGDISLETDDTIQETGD